MQHIKPTSGIVVVTHKGEIIKIFVQGFANVDVKQLTEGRVVISDTVPEFIDLGENQ